MNLNKWKNIIFRELLKGTDSKAGEIIRHFGGWLMPRINLRRKDVYGDSQIEAAEELYKKLDNLSVDSARETREIIAERKENELNLILDTASEKLWKDSLSRKDPLDRETTSEFLDNIKTQSQQEINEKYDGNQESLMTEVLAQNLDKIFQGFVNLSRDEAPPIKYSLPGGAQIINSWGSRVVYDFNYTEDSHLKMSGAEDMFAVIGGGRPPSWPLLTPVQEAERKFLESEYAIAHAHEKHPIGNYIIKKDLPPGVDSIEVEVLRIGGGADTDFVEILQRIVTKVYQFLEDVGLEHLFQNRIFRPYGTKLKDLRPPVEGCGAYDPATQEILISDVNLAGTSGFLSKKLFKLKAKESHHYSYFDLPSGIEKHPCAKSATDLLLTIIHELGHAYYAESLNSEQRFYFSQMYFSDRREIMPGVEVTSGCISSRSVDQFEEDFAETFTFLLASDIINTTYLRGTSTAPASPEPEEKRYFFNETAIKRFMDVLQGAEDTQQDANSIAKLFKNVQRHFCSAYTKNGRHCTMPVVKRTKYCTVHQAARNRGKPKEVTFAVPESLNKYIENLQKKGVEALPEVTELLARKDLPLGFASGAEKLLKNILIKLIDQGDTGVPALESLLSSREERIRWNAMDALNQIHTAKAKEAFIRRARPGSSFTRFLLEWEKPVKKFLPEDSEVKKIDDWKSDLHNKMSSILSNEDEEDEEETSKRKMARRRASRLNRRFA